MRYHRVRQAVQDGEVKFHLLGTKDMLADLFTKTMGGSQFVKLRDLCMGYGVKPGLPAHLVDCLSRKGGRKMMKKEEEE